MSRSECAAWFSEMYPGRTLRRSPCVGWPFRCSGSWVEVKAAAPDLFAEAVAIDAGMRDPEHHIQGVFTHTPLPASSAHALVRSG